MNATTGNVSAFVWDEVNFTSTGTTVDYHFNGDIGVSTVPSFTVEKENIEIELKWIEPLALIMDAFFVAVAFVAVALFVCFKLSAAARMRFGRRFEVDMRFGTARPGANCPDAINERNVALRTLV